MSKGWVQFLLVAVPVLGLIGAWATLRAWPERPRDEASDDEGK
ncbi:hypothetical protein [Denitromonas halophila]|nr:hypothetical protein [Denitromonas halophila]